MAIAATLLGGIFGFVSFLTALLLGYGFLSAGAIYLSVGFGTVFLVFIAAMLKPRPIETEARTA